MDIPRCYRHTFIHLYTYTRNSCIFVYLSVYVLSIPISIYLSMSFYVCVCMSVCAQTVRSTTAPDQSRSIPSSLSCSSSAFPTTETASGPDDDTGGPPAGAGCVTCGFFLPKLQHWKICEIEEPSLYCTCTGPQDSICQVASEFTPSTGKDTDEQTATGEAHHWESVVLLCSCSSSSRCSCSCSRGGCCRCCWLW